MPGLQVFEHTAEGDVRRLPPPQAGKTNWSRIEVAGFCAQAVEQACRQQAPVIIGIDHAFGFPASYLERYALTDWDAFLDDFVHHWPADRAGVCVDDLRPGNPRSGANRELRLCERWTAGAKSVFLFDVQGSVAKSTHAGLPWLFGLRRTAMNLHCWPFDGFTVPPDRSVVAEVYPSLLRRRYPQPTLKPDAQDAHAVAAWLADMDRRGALERYLEPPLTPDEAKLAQREGWILGVG